MKALEVAAQSPTLTKKSRALSGFGGTGSGKELSSGTKTLVGSFTANHTASDIFGHTGTHNAFASDPSNEGEKHKSSRRNRSPDGSISSAPYCASLVKKKRKMKGQYTLFVKARCKEMGIRFIPQRYQDPVISSAWQAMPEAEKDAYRVAAGKVPRGRCASAFVPPPLPPQPFNLKVNSDDDDSDQEWNTEAAGIPSIAGQVMASYSVASKETFLLFLIRDVLELIRIAVEDGNPETMETVTEEEQSLTPCPPTPDDEDDYL